MKSMTEKKAIQYTRKGAALLAIALAAVIPFTGLAETVAQETAPAASTAVATVRAAAPGRGGHGFAYGSFSLDMSALTEEQKSAYTSAVSLYEQVEDAVLSDLAAAGVVAQSDVDSYIALRTAEKSIASLDQSSWTAQQYKAYYEANAKTGDERKAAMQALVEAGQLTQAQADALSAQGQSCLWAAIQKNAGTNSVIQTALSTMQQAQRTLSSTLKEAGITGMGKGLMPGSMNGDGFGEKNYRQGMDRNSNGNGSNNNGKGGRK